MLIQGCSVAEWLACWAWVEIAAATLPSNSLRQTVDIHRASVHQAAKLVTALLRVARVTAGLVENNGSLPSAGFMTHVTCRLAAKNRDQLRNATLGNRVWAAFTFYCGFCGGSKIAISHRQSQSPLTQGWRYRAARDGIFYMAGVNIFLLVNYLMHILPDKYYRTVV